MSDSPAAVKKRRGRHSSLSNSGLYEVEVPLSARQRTQVRRGLQKQRAVRLHVTGRGSGERGGGGSDDMYKFYLPYSDGSRFMKRFSKGLGGRFTIIPNLQTHYSPAMLTAMAPIAASAAPSANAGSPAAAGVVAVDTSGIVDGVDDVVPSQGKSKKRSITGRGGGGGGGDALPSDAEVLNEIEALTGATAAGGSRSSKRKRSGKGVSISGHSSSAKADPQKAKKSVKATKGLGMPVDGSGLVFTGTRAGDGIHIPGNPRGSGVNFPLARAAAPAQS